MVSFAILNIKKSNCCCISSRISKNETINSVENTNWTKKKQIIKHKNLLSHVVIIDNW